MTVFKTIKNKIISILGDRQGTTLVEMIVSFALLGILLASAATVIATITTMHYSISGEIYSREVSDIIMEKIVSEIDGAQYLENPDDNPKIIDNTSVTLFDKTGTYVTLSADSEKNGLKVHYHGIEYINNGMKDEVNSRDPEDWYFDETMYKGFLVEEIKFYGCGSGNVNGNDVSTYGLPSGTLSDYNGNVVLVLLKLRSDKYGEYKYYRYVKMYNVPEEYDWSDS
ncbi:MAG: prepilin-type N-terminal cleavage/methylation domain-containing protein [Eubacterium sp.]|nr:prepilin-type N-terminal cleavage/methylation domain-containing protein [Eubacterium sp.]